MEPFDLETYVGRSRALDLNGIEWSQVPLYPLPDEAIRALRYMQDIEAHTIIYLRQLLATRAVDDPEIATFLACWIYEESFHGLALERFLEAAGHPVSSTPRRRSYQSLAGRINSLARSVLSWAWPDFVALHMTWGAVNELTTLTGYQRLIELTDHPVLSELLRRIIRDESRHFFFYYRQADRRLSVPRVGRAARFFIERFWSPVGSGVQPGSETRALARYFFTGQGGREAARKVDETIGRLPGLGRLRLLEAWLEKALPSMPSGAGRPHLGETVPY